MKKVLAMMLCMVMIVTMTACSGGGTETTGALSTSAGAGSEETLSGQPGSTAAEVTEPESTEPESTEPEPTAQERYDQALSLLEQMESMTLEINSSIKTTLGSDTFNEKSIQTLILQNIGQESFSASLTDKTYRGTYFTECEEVFIGGKMYYHVTPKGEASVNYATEMTAEEYMERMLPASLLSAELYETVEMTAENMIAFSGGSTPEDWIGAEGAELTEVSGSAQLNEDGTLAKSTYKAVYRQGSAVISCEVSVAVKPGEDKTITAPDGADSYRMLEGEAYLGPYLVQHAIGYIMQMDAFTAAEVESAVAAATGWSYVYQETVNAFSGPGMELAKIDYLYQMTDLNTGEYYYNDVVKEEFKNGKYTYTANDQEPEVYQLDYSAITDSVEAGSVRAIPSQTYLHSFEVGNYGGTILVEYPIGSELDKELSVGVSALMFADPNTLDDLATAYRTEEAVGYIGIDAATGIPTAVGFDYTGVHTIEGAEYQLVYAVTRSFQVGHDSTYEAITGEPPVEEESGNAAPLFYKVTGANGQQMWLLGTIHIGDQRTGKLPLEIMDAFDASDALAVEYDTNAFEERMEADQEYAMQIVQMYMYTDGTTTQDHIEDPEVYEYATKLMKAAGLTDMYTSLYKPSIWSQNIDNYHGQWNYELSSEHGMDSQLLDWAEEQGKEIRDVESAVSQIQMITGYSDALQEWLLAGSLSTTPAEYVRQSNELYELWCAGNEAEMIEYLSESDTSGMTDEELVLYQEYTKAMETDRNAAMLEVAKQYLESSDVVFYAVGLAHLLAEDGLVNTLRDAGYTVERVSYSE